MAIIKPTPTALRQGDSVIPGVNIITWANIKAGDTCEALTLPHFADRSIQFVSNGPNFGGAQASLLGSNDGANYEVLTDPQGNDITKNGADLEAVTEVTAYVKPQVAGGDPTTDITAILLIRGEK